MNGYVLREGEGRGYIWNGFSFTVKAGHPETKGAVGFMEFACESGDEPSDHVHDGEDEVFVLLEGAMTVRCGSDEFDVDVGDFVFLPRDVRHGFTIRTDRVRMFVVTAPDDFSRRVEGEGSRVGDDVSDWRDRHLGGTTRRRSGSRPSKGDLTEEIDIGGRRL